MEDSVTPSLTPVIGKSLTKAEKEEITTLAVRNTDGTIRLANKGSDGKFRKSKKTVPMETRDLTILLRRMLMAPQKDKDGRITKESKSHLTRVFENILDIATCPSLVPMADKNGNVVLDSKGEVVMTRDAKMAQASVKAGEMIMARAFGKVQPGDEEMDSLRIAGIKVVVVQSPELIHKEVVKEVAKQVTKPSFAQVTSVETNPKEETSAS